MNMKKIIAYGIRLRFQSDPRKCLYIKDVKKVKETLQVETDPHCAMAMTEYDAMRVSESLDKTDLVVVSGPFDAQVFKIGPMEVK